MTAASLPGWMADITATAQRVTAADLTRMPAPPDEAVAAAVLLAFAGTAAQIDDGHVLLVRRAAGLRAHAGHIAFPGGRVDDDDENATAAALRETREETGLCAEQIRVTATLPQLYIPASSFAVTPVLGWVTEPHPVHVNSPVEIDEVQWVCLGELLDPAHRVMARHRSGFTGPAFWAGDWFIWGFTAGLLARLLHQAGFTRPWDTSAVVDIPESFAAPGR